MSPMTAAVRAKKTGLYRLYDTEDALLYVGIAVDPAARWKVHAGEKSWWSQVTRKAVDWFPNRWAAEAAEESAIVAELPRHNVTHSTTRKRGDAKGEYQSKSTPVRRVRVAAQMWSDFGKAAGAAGTTRAALVVQFIAWYLRKPGAKLPTRPAVVQAQSEAAE